MCTQYKAGQLGRLAWCCNSPSADGGGIKKDTGYCNLI